MSLFRSGWWPGRKPTIEKGRIMCSDCDFHSSAMAGWQWDRCHHPDADYGSIVRNDQPLTCADCRLSESQCGEQAKWYKPRNAGNAGQ